MGIDPDEGFIREIKIIKIAIILKLFFKKRRIF